MKKHYYSILLIALGLFLPVSAGDFGRFLEKREKLWSAGKTDLDSEYKGKFRWLDSQQNQLRATASKNDPLTLCGEPLPEVIITLDEQKKICSLMLSVYNRGDAGEWEEKRFTSKLEQLRSMLNKFTQSQPPENQTAPVGSGSKIYASIWRLSNLDIVLRWGNTNRQKPEYISLEFLPPGNAPKTIRGAVKTTLGTGNLAEQVKQDADGTRYLEIPMVDQGQKGYCSAATVERILRYYGSDVDMHVIAQLAASDVKGTNNRALTEAIEAAAPKLGIRFKVHYEHKAWHTEKDIEKFCKDYNSIAQKQNKTKLRASAFYSSKNGGGKFQKDDFLNALDYEIYSKLRMGEKSDYASFVKLVRTNIDNGIPLCWSVLTFHNDPQNKGVGHHMRIINGYNSQTDKIIYTDSWGLGHEKKEMSTQDAWTISQKICSLIPRNRGSQ